MAAVFIREGGIKLLANADYYARKKKTLGVLQFQEIGFKSPSFNQPTRTR